MVEHQYLFLTDMEEMIKLIPSIKYWFIAILTKHLHMYYNHQLYAYRPFLDSLHYRMISPHFHVMADILVG